MKNYFLLVLFLATNLSVGQYESIDKKMDEIPVKFEESTTQVVDYINSNFTSVDDKARAAFYWTASTISYDVENMLNQPKQTPDERISRVLKSKKGVCMHYAQVFYDIMNKLNIETILIDGYTKDMKGKIATLSHVWCASKINNTWFLFDPTWGSGYVNDSKFTKKIDNKFYKAEPKSLINRHMPFDYLWQFSNKPINNQEFYDSKSEATDKTMNFDYLKEIDNLKNLSELEKTENRVERIQKNGLKNKLILDILDFEKTKMSFYNQKKDFNKLDEIVADFNESNMKFNEFLNYKNKKFIPLVSDEDLKSKIQIPYELLLRCIKESNELKDLKRENITIVTNLKRAMNASKIKFDTNLKFVDEFISKEIPERAKMFMKTTTRG